MQILATLAVILAFPLLTLGQNPCSSDAHSQFDFWVGEWEVFHATADTLVGRNTIKRILNGCVIEENWKGATGFEGKSFNTYNAADSTWRQVWVDVSGATYHFKGRYADKVMQMYGETTGSNGQTAYFDMSYTFDPTANTVRQVWKLSQDNKASWATIFDGIYRRKD